MPIEDIAVEDPPLEDVIAEVFAQVERGRSDGRRVEQSEAGDVCRATVQ